VAALGSLEGDPPSPTLNVKPWQGAPPWVRLRVGEYRVALFPLEREELFKSGYEAERGWVVWLIASRQAFVQAARRLP
jgi:hypothetical protein